MAEKLALVIKSIVPARIDAWSKLASIANSRALRIGDLRAAGESLFAVDSIFKAVQEAQDEAVLISSILSTKLLSRHSAVSLATMLSSLMSTELSRCRTVRFMDFTLLPMVKLANISSIIMPVVEYWIVSSGGGNASLSSHCRTTIGILTGTLKNGTLGGASTGGHEEKDWVQPKKNYARLALGGGGGVFFDAGKSFAVIAQSRPKSPALAAQKSPLPSTKPRPKMYFDRREKSGMEREAGFTFADLKSAVDVRRKQNVVHASTIVVRKKAKEKPSAIVSLARLMMSPGLSVAWEGRHQSLKDDITMSLPEVASFMPNNNRV